jgi:hypothetical protein
MLVFCSRLRLSFLLIFLCVLLSTCTDEEEKKRAFPQVRTLEVESITAEGAVFKGEIRDYPQPISERGFMWSVNESYIGLNTTVSLGPGSGEGTFEAAISHDLMADTIYYVWAYAKTATHTVNGEIKSFRSLGSKAPVIHSIEPKLVTWLDTLVIKGERFSQNPLNVSAKINGITLPIISNSLTEIKVRMPLGFHGPKGKVELAVFNNVVVYPDSVELKAPLISSVEPSEGMHGEEVTILGSYFHPDLSRAFFNEFEAEIVSRTSNSVTCIVPEDLPRGSSSVKLQVGDHSLIANEKFFCKIASLTDFFPKEGTFDDLISITGEFDLRGTTRVQFVFTPAPIVSMTGTEIVIKVPSHRWASTRITIHNNGKELVSNESFRMLPPEIHSFTEVVDGLLDYITITGKNFNPYGNNHVSIDNVFAPCTALSSTELRAQVPVGVTSNEVPIRVEGTGGRVEAEHRLKIRWLYRDIVLYFSVPKSGLKVLYNDRLYAGIQGGSPRWHMLLVSSLGHAELASFPGQSRFGHGYFVIGDYLYIAGGFMGSTTPPLTTTPTNEVWRYHFPTNSWSRRGDLPFPGSSNEMVGFSYENTGYLIHFGKLYSYYPGTDTWIERDLQLPQTASSKGVIVGNYYYHKPLGDSEIHRVMRYDVVNNVWETMNSDFDLIDNPTFAFSYKGRPVFGNDRAFSIYNPATNQWMTTSFIYPDNARFGFEFNNGMAFFNEYPRRLFTFREDF